MKHIGMMIILNQTKRVIPDKDPGMALENLVKFIIYSSKTESFGNCFFMSAGVMSYMPHPAT